jgi:ABC-type nitrate/sulfonate/bicarbonate transport system substrate-binding protein
MPRQRLKLAGVGGLGVVIVLLLIASYGQATVADPARIVHSSRVAPSPVKSVHFQLGYFIQPTLIIAGQTEGDFKDLSVKFVSQASGVAALPLIVKGTLAGQGDIAALPLIIAHAKHLPVHVVWINSVLYSQLVVKSSAAPGAGLRGMTLTSPQGSIDYYNLYGYLKNNGLAFSDIKYVDLDPSAINAAFKTGQIDGAQWSPPVTTQMIADGGKLIEQTPTPVYTLFSDKFIRSHSDVVQQYVCDLADVQVRFHKNPTRVYKDIASKVGLTPATLAPLLVDKQIPPRNETTRGPWEFGSRSFVQNILGVGQGMATFNQIATTDIPTAAQVKAMFDPQFVKGVANGACK